MYSVKKCCSAVSHKILWCRMISSVETVVSNFNSIKYSVSNVTAEILLNRPLRFNAIDEHMPGEIKKAVELSNLNDAVKIIVVRGAGKSFCSGYDLKKFAEAPRGSNPCSQEMPWDPHLDYQFMSAANECYLSLWKSLKPTVAVIHGACLGGGTDIALLCDLTIAADDAKIGYPPARVWGCPTAAMWVYRLGVEKAKRVLFAGKVLSGLEAVQIGLIGAAVPMQLLDDELHATVAQLQDVPTNQLFFQKLVINNAIEQMGLFSTQRLATLIDGMTRHTPEGVRFQQRCQSVGFKQAVLERDAANAKL